MNDLNNMNSQLRNTLTPQRMQMLAFVTVGAVVATVALAVLLSWWFLCLGPLIYLGLIAFLIKDALPALSGAKPQAPSLASPLQDMSRLEGNYHASMERALQTRARIEQVVAQTDDLGLRGALADSTRELPELTQTIYDLALKAQSIRAALFSSGDMTRLSAEVERLNTSIRGTNDEFQKSQYHAALDGKLQQMQNFTDTTVALQRWDAQLDNAISTLDTILSQVVRIRSSEVLQRTSATDDVSRDLREQVESLKAASDAFDTLYGGSSKF